MTQDREILVAVGKVAAGAVAEDGALGADVVAVREPGDVGVPVGS